MHAIFDIKDNGAYTSDVEQWRSPHSTASVSQLGQVSIPFRNGNETVEVLAAYTLKHNGERHDVGLDRILTQQAPAAVHAPMYGDLQVKTIIFPDVEVGDYVVYHIRTTQKAPDFPGRFSTFYLFPTAQLFDDVRITFRYPESYPMQFEARAVTSASERTVGNMTERTWTYHNTRPVPEESGAVDAFDRDPHLLATSFKDWREFASLYDGMRGGTARVTPDIQRLADDLTRGKTAPEDQAAALYRWVSRNIRYVAVYLGAGGYVPHDASAVLQNRYGDCKDHATLLEALLAAKGIASSPILIDTAARYTLPDLPFAQAFNHMITYVPSLEAYLDSTAGVQPFAVLNGSTQDKPVLRVHDFAAISQTPAATAARNTLKTAVQLDMTAGGDATGNITVAATGVLAAPLRSMMVQRATSPQRQEFIQKYLTQRGLIGAGELSGDEPFALLQQYNVHVALNLQGLMRSDGPGTLNIPSGLFSPEPIKAIVGLLNQAPPAVEHLCFARTLEEDNQVALPKTVGLEKLPADVHFNNALGSYTAHYAFEQHTLHLKRALITIPPHNHCDPTQMQQLRAIADVVSKDAAAPIIYRQL